MSYYSLIGSIFSNIVVTAKKCTTSSGSKCIFPFKYGGRTHHRCTTVDLGTFWCPTRVDSFGYVKETGSCGEECVQGIYNQSVYSTL